MDIEQFKADILEVLKKHNESLVAMLYGITYQDKEGNIAVFSTAAAQVPPRDKEEKVLRDMSTRKVGEEVVRLTENIFLGR